MSASSFSSSVYCTLKASGRKCGIIGFLRAASRMRIVGKLLLLAKSCIREEHPCIPGLRYQSISSNLRYIIVDSQKQTEVRVDGVVVVEKGWMSSKRKGRGDVS